MQIDTEDTGNSCNAVSSIHLLCVAHTAYTALAVACLPV